MSNTTKTIGWILAAAITITVAVAVYNWLILDGEPIIVLKPKKPLKPLDAGSLQSTPGWFHQTTSSNEKIEVDGPALPPNGSCKLRSDFLAEKLDYLEYWNDGAHGKLNKVTFKADNLELTIERAAGGKALKWTLIDDAGNKCPIGSAWTARDGGYKRIPKEFVTLMEPGSGYVSVTAYDGDDNLLEDLDMVKFRLK